ncbi:MAG: response regulator, partial [Thiovulaceae bacterium]|nr:response regulator [Sulfurimonadaceae bacterium]
MYSAKDLKHHSKELQVLYVEDDEHLRFETSKLFELFFKKVDLAENGLIGLDQYSNNEYDLVLTDINMPEMNGIEMMQKIKEINPEQKIMAISAHNEPDILINLIKAGIDGFVLKPVIHQEVINNLYSICRDCAAQKLNLSLMEELQTQKDQLEKQNKELQRQLNTIDTKHNQVEKLLVTVNEKNDDYFTVDEDEGEENVILFSDHCVDLTEIFEEIPQI